MSAPAANRPRMQTARATHFAQPMIELKPSVPGGWIGSGWRWWTGELAELVPPALRRQFIDEGGEPVRARAIIGGDALSLSIAAASILAKVARDRIMVDLAQQHPGYGWERNMGYPTAEHRSALRDLGPTPFHRRGFPAVHKILCPELSLTD